MPLAPTSTQAATGPADGGLGISAGVEASWIEGSTTDTAVPLRTLDRPVTRDMYETFTKGHGGCQDLSVSRPLLIRPAAVLSAGATEPTAGLEVLVVDGLIAAVGPALQMPEHEDAEVVELADAVLAPGFVDLHVHELGGCGVIDATAPDLPGLAEALGQRGTTAFLATTVTAPVDDLLSVVEHVAEHVAALSSGTPLEGHARCLGVHLEGPWLSPARAGAQPAADIAAPSPADLAKLIDAGPVRMVTLAPELPGASDLIALARERGVVVALGHSDVDYRTAADAVAAGARHITHCFNAMRPLHHRDPGLVGAALDLPDVSVELIADGLHLHPATARLIHRAVGADRACVVSDAVDRGTPQPDGPLVGASVTQDAGVHNLVSWGVPLADALRMAGTTPAGVVGLEHGIRAGLPADLVAVTRDGELVATFIAGVRT
jgi:N-acetylglucosamine-6-phosphate deacetylase